LICRPVADERVALVFAPAAPIVPASAVPGPEPPLTLERAAPELPVPAVPAPIAPLPLSLSLEHDDRQAANPDEDRDTDALADAHHDNAP
jgi:hypothetical protein